MGRILLAGGAEFGGAMAAPDRRAIELAGGPSAPIVILPTAAAPDANHVRAGNIGRDWFADLGARDIRVVPVIDEASSNDASHAAHLHQARLIYLLGGFTHFLGQILRQSRAWDAIFQAYLNGAVVAGSSAGAMVLCEYYFNPEAGAIETGLNLVPNACVLPHHDTFGVRWSRQVRQLLPNATLLGIDERTGMIDDGEVLSWEVAGAAGVTIYWPGSAAEQRAKFYPAGSRIELPASPDP